MNFIVTQMNFIVFYEQNVDTCVSIAAQVWAIVILLEPIAVFESTEYAFEPGKLDTFSYKL